MTPNREPAEVLQHGELTVLGRIRSASNATFLCEAELDGHRTHCVYKPVAGEQPLWDFPDGTLAGRELGTFLISAALGWDIVPHTIIRSGPAGEGMVQRWVDQPEPEPDTESESELDLVDLCPADQLPAGYLPVLRAQDYAGAEVLLIHADDPRLARMAVFDILVNNADRKGGHILSGIDGQVYGVDHGLCLHTEDKLRTVLWGWAGKPIDDAVLEAVSGLQRDLDGALAEQLAPLVTGAEIAALRTRIREVLDDPVMPSPHRSRPIPWPAF
ncbi:SCO1664 family protein [[Mycobacterium] burgundiense]|uniref:SCO1664 family protein n=1 Tax=[Mycobacterium] burgundiense TaxID=3064286 RepID=A0ABM9LP20_9MYCO|nr:SCO1664 family protein [Mycolicibacterium sp. MU0053]CAJ1502207.1 SCO1664 family protein [Mycolicibacterium sp. MU0053]